MEKLYKWLNEDGTPHNGGHGVYNLPTKNADGSWTPGEWMPEVQGELVLCKNAYHLCRERDLIYWIGPALYEAEADSDKIEDNVPPETKIGVRRVRLLRRVETWNDRTARLFAIWCAREALRLIDNPDQRSVAACDIAERHANGQATQEELTAAGAAARAAARAAAGDAAGDAAGAAAGDAQTKKLIEMLGL